MNAAQNRRYFYEWAQLRACLLARGRTHAECEDFRATLTVRAVGYAKSHMDFTDAEFTAWRKKCAAARRPDSLDAQMEIENSEEKLRARKLEACHRACWEIYNQGANNSLADHERAERYIAGIAWKVVGDPLDKCTSAQLAKVLGILEVHVERAKKQNAERTAALRGTPVPAAEKSEDAENPF